MNWHRLLTVALLPVAGGILSASESMSEIVLQLGHANFHKRVAAEQELLARGAEGLRLAAAGARSNDPEIRQRAQRLLNLLQKLAFVEQREQVKNDPWTVAPELAPGWEVYQSLVGDGLAARSLYVRMIEQEPELMMSVVLRPHEWSYDMERRCADLRTFFDRRYSQELNQASVATLLFLSVYPDAKLSPLSAGTVASLISEAEFYNTVQRAPEPEQAVYQALLSHWVQRSGHSSPASRLQLAGRFQLPAGVAPAREIVANRKSLGQSQAQLQHAIGFLGRYGALEDVPKLETLLDQDRLNALRLVPASEGEIVEPTKKTDPRRRLGKEDSGQQDLIINDIALRALVVLTGQNPDDYGFPKQRGEPERRTISNAPGFTNDVSRSAALARWLSWRTEHANRLNSVPPDASEGIPL